MNGSPSAIVSLGFGSWGSVNLVVTLGFGSAVIAADVVIPVRTAISHLYEPGTVESSVYESGSRRGTVYHSGSKASLIVE